MSVGICAVRVSLVSFTTQTYKGEGVSGPDKTAGCVEYFVKLKKIMYCKRQKAKHAHLLIFKTVLVGWFQHSSKNKTD